MRHRSVRRRQPQSLSEGQQCALKEQRTRLFEKFAALSVTSEKDLDLSEAPATTQELLQMDWQQEADFIKTEDDNVLPEPIPLDPPTITRLWGGKSPPAFNFTWLINQLTRHNFSNRRFIRRLKLARKEGGFRMENNLEYRTVESTNGRSAYQNKDITDAKVRDVLNKGFGLGPFTRQELPFAHIRTSGIFVIPRKTKGKWRLIVHMSAPDGDSVNSNRELNVPVRYHTVDFAAQRLASLTTTTGETIYMIKEDIDAFYNRLPIRPAEWWQFVIRWRDPFSESNEEFYYILPVVPFGSIAGVEISSQVSRAMHFLFIRPNNEVPEDKYTCVVYCDDFLIMATREWADAAKQRLRRLLAIAGIPISADPRKQIEAKIETTKLYLGIRIDSVRMRLSIDAERVNEIRTILDSTAGQTFLLRSELQSIAGKLNFAAKCIRHGRTFMRRIWIAIKRSHGKRWTKLGFGVRNDFKTWKQLMQAWNGVECILPPPPTTPSVRSITSDATPSRFCVVNRNSKQFVHGDFPEWANNLDISSKELITMHAVSLIPWSTPLQQCQFIFGDNMSAVQCINRRDAPSAAFSFVLREQARHEIATGQYFPAVHVPTKQNILADAPTRHEWDRFDKELTKLNLVLQEIPMPLKFFDLLRTMSNIKSKTLQHQAQRAEKANARSAMQ